VEEIGIQRTSQLAKGVIAQIVARVTSLGEDPFPSGVKKLAGAEHTYRIRFSSYRVIYTVSKDNRIVEIVRVGHRQSAYKP
jgi:mRNA interferase RelE/StbE